MSSGQTPSGPPVPNHENVYRSVHPTQLVGGGDKISSAVFRQSIFSVDRVLLTTKKDSLSRFKAGSKLAEFNCGDARDLGYDTRDEPDEEYPDNKAHAHVYHPGGISQRKKAARDLVKEADLLPETLDDLT